MFFFGSEAENDGFIVELSILVDTVESCGGKFLRLSCASRPSSSELKLEMRFCGRSKVGDRMAVFVENRLWLIFGLGF